MSLPALYKQPATPEEWKAWSFNHAVNHYNWISAAATRQQNPTVLQTNAATAAGNNVLSFASTKALEVNGQIYQMYVADQTVPDAIAAGTVIQGSNDVQIEMSTDAVSPGVGSGDSIAFTPVETLQLQQFQLDPINLQNLSLWLYWHQAMHNQVNQVLGTQGFDLLSLDWADPDQLQLWLQLNGDEHIRISAALGVN